MDKKIPCIVLVYYSTEVIKKSLDFITKASDKLDIIVLENRSENTEKLIKPYLSKLLECKKISMYVEFLDNITNNALEEFFDTNIIDLNAYENIIITDGDVLGDSNEWISEEENILKNNPEVLVCGVDLKTDNLPLETFEEAPKWVPKIINSYDDYSECPTGMQLLMVRTKIMPGFFDYMERKEEKFKDSAMFDYFYDELNKKWGKTKINRVQHLTWTIYGDLDDPYTKYKLSRSHTEHWHHDRYCDFIVHTKNEEKRYEYQKKKKAKKGDLDE